MIQGERERQFENELRRVKNLEVRRMAEDGNCLFRSIADQIYGDAEMYSETRQMCIDYMVYLVPCFVCSKYVHIQYLHDMEPLLLLWY
jgi:hypothetical protein